MKIKINKNIEYHIVGNEILVLVINDNSFYKLNETASQIFNLIISKKNYDSIIEEFSNLNNISKEKAKIDINIFIKESKKNNILLQ